MAHDLYIRGGSWPGSEEVCSFSYSLLCVLEGWVLSVRVAVWAILVGWGNLKFPYTKFPPAGYHVNNIMHIPVLSNDEYDSDDEAVTTCTVNTMPTSTFQGKGCLWQDWEMKGLGWEAPPLQQEEEQQEERGLAFYWWSLKHAASVHHGHINKEVLMPR